MLTTQTINSTKAEPEKRSNATYKKLHISIQNYSQKSQQNSESKRDFAYNKLRLISYDSKPTQLNKKTQQE